MVGRVGRHRSTVAVDQFSQPGRTTREGVPGGARPTGLLAVITDPASVQATVREDIAGVAVTAPDGTATAIAGGQHVSTAQKLRSRKLATDVPIVSERFAGEVGCAVTDATVPSVSVTGS